MKNLFIGGSSDIAKKVAKKLTYVESISRKKSIIYNKNYVVKSYTNKNLNKIFAKFNIKFDNIVIFNGYFSNSFISNYNEKDFNESFNINFKTPITLATLSINSKILNKNGCIFFISSIAAETNQIGNAFYSISKNCLNFAAKILGNEQKKRGIRVNSISLGIVKNKMGKSVLGIKFKKKGSNYLKNDKFVKKLIKIIKNKKFNLKKIIIK
jgi:short-subunit dehydrogenase